MSFEHQPTTDEMLARMSAAVAANHYGILRLSARRWAVVRRQVSLGRKVVGYGTIEPRGGGRLGAELKDPQVLIDHVEYEIVEGCDKMTYEIALKALYDLTHGGNG